GARVRSCAGGLGPGAAHPGPALDGVLRQVFFFKQKTAYEVGLGIPAEPLFRSKEMTRKVSAEVDLVHQQTQNQRYGSSHIGATAKDISNVVTDAASGVVDIFHGIDKAVADTWNNFWKD